MKFLCEAEVPLGEVDEDGNIGTAAVDLAQQLLVLAENLRQVGDDLGKADDGDVLRADDSIEAGGAHAFAARAEEFDISLPASERLDHLGAVGVARSFAGREENPHEVSCKLPVVSWWPYRRTRQNTKASPR